MGVTMFSILAVTIGSTYIEWQSVTRLPWLHSLYVHGLGPIPGKLINFAVSLVLSSFLDKLLGGHGSAAFVGGLLSTIVVAVLISTKEVANTHGVTWIRAKGEFTSAAEEVGGWLAAHRDDLRNVVVFFGWVIQTISLFVKVVFGTINFIVEHGNNARDRFEAAKARVS